MVLGASYDVSGDFRDTLAADSVRGLMVGKTIMEV